MSFMPGKHGGNHSNNRNLLLFKIFTFENLPLSLQLSVVYTVCVSLAHIVDTVDTHWIRVQCFKVTAVEMPLFS